MIDNGDGSGKGTANGAGDGYGGGYGTGSASGYGDGYHRCGRGTGYGHEETALHIRMKETQRVRHTHKHPSNHPFK